ncbi:outer membrane beta-barrel protein [Hyunsoonleella sp. 2307UL5-6]|uniref:outer membrane beta-barrel protein n=1 Tax=Hyunsoonleella sp. 2307UL5-6 TaxID=3384768 RepID=UPI0039BC9D55
MKKHLLIALSILSFQSIFSQDITYGIELGTSVSTILELNPNSKGYATTPKGNGIYFGGFINYKIAEKIGIYGSLAYDNRKSNFSIDENNDLIINHNYLTVNPSVKFSLAKTYNKGFYLRPGIRYSFFLSASDKEDQFEIVNNFNGVFAGNIAFGFDINDYIGLELCFDYSLNDILNDTSSKQLSGIFKANINLQKILE